MLCSNYGTQFVIQRVILENNNLMRLFNKNPKYAFEWLPREQQVTFSAKTQQEFKGCVEKKEFWPSKVRKEFFQEAEKAGLSKLIGNIYDYLSNYAHPNSSGWVEVMGLQGIDEVL